MLSASCRMSFVLGFVITTMGDKSIVYFFVELAKIRF